MSESQTKILGNAGGVSYIVLGISSVALGMLQTYSSLLGARQGRTSTEDASEGYLFIVAVTAFLIGMVSYRILAMRQGFHPAWIWYAILASGLAMVFAGIVTGRIVLILFGVSNLLHVFGTRDLYFPK